jgi:sigma-B regulation protein RsbU (phosphoserine phosphatase)
MTVPAGSRLYVYSDGVYEVQMPDGREMALEDFISLVAEPPAGITSVRAAVSQLQGKTQFDDDFSLIELVFD